MGTETQQWKVGDVTITSVVEEETWGVPPEFFFPEADADAVLRHAWVVPDFASASGKVALRIQALVVEAGGRRVLVDPCVGNLKPRSFPFWNEQTWPFMERFTEAGFDPVDIDLVVHTHLHADHVGWDTHLDGGSWVPTFTGARHLYTQRELDALRGPAGSPDDDAVHADSVVPIFDAGLADVVDEDADLGGGLRLEPSTGHTPGHVSLWIESGDELAIVTGDFIHHPVQCAEPTWAEIGDADVEQARATRRRMLGRAAESGALVIGTHFPNRPAGRVVADAASGAWRFVPV